MKSILTLVLAMFFIGTAGAGIAQDLPEGAPPDPDAEQAVPDSERTLQFLDAREIDVREYIWKRRLIVVMADTPEDPLFNQQIEAIRARAEEFAERDVAVVYDAHPEDRSDLRQVMRPNGFSVAIIDKDGEVKARRPAVRSGRELMGIIDKFPLRRQEMLEERPAGR